MKYVTYILLLSLFLACGENKDVKKMVPDESKKITLMTLEPGHFHAALVHKTMYDEVDSTIHIFASEGPEVQDFLNKIASYNSRETSPTRWSVKTHLGDNYLKAMLSQKPGNVMVVAGKNSQKIDYVLEAVKEGLNVYADKPLVINAKGFEKLKMAFKIAEENGVMIYDIMTERFEATTVMQKLFSQIPEVFGEMINGSQEQPAIVKESIHHFYKHVSGQPLVRPAWFFDVNEEGEGIVDVTTHLVDLVQWTAFSERIVDSSDIEMLYAKRWPTVLTNEEFKKVTGLEDFPEYLDKDLKDNKLYVYSNGEMVYKINQKHAKVSVIWNYQAPEGTGDTHYSIMRGTKANLIIKQGVEENYKPTLYIETKQEEGFSNRLEKAIDMNISNVFQGTTMEQVSNSVWKIHIPEEFKIGHEAHFAQVTKNYLNYLGQGNLPVWEVPNMITKYYTTIEGLEMALKADGND